MTQRFMTVSRQGFTLIELSIVLVIIGLIVGGIMTGETLIRSAELRSDISEADKINTAINTFKLKYNCLPGDCANATALFPAASQPQRLTNGNGDGIINGVLLNIVPMNSAFYNAQSASAEWYSLFDHLAAAGLYSLPQYDETNVANLVNGSAFAKMHYVHGGLDPNMASLQPSIAGGIVAGYEGDGNYLHYGACYINFPGWTGVLGFLCGYTAQAAFTFDGKIDDGLPYSGSVQVTDSIYVLRVYGGAPGVSDEYCANSPTYSKRDDARACALRVKGAF